MWTCYAGSASIPRDAAEGQPIKTQSVELGGVKDLDRLDVFVSGAGCWLCRGFTGRPPALLLRSGLLYSLGIAAFNVLNGKLHKRHGNLRDASLLLKQPRGADAHMIRQSWCKAAVKSCMTCLYTKLLDMIVWNK